MRASEVRKLVTTYRIAVPAVLHGKIPGEEVAIADLDAALSRFRQQGDWQVTGTDVPTSFVALNVAMMRQWSGAKGPLREALTGCTTAMVDTLAKWLDGELLPKAERVPDYFSKIGG